MNSKIVVLLTDFGRKDAYAGIMKGVILCLDPGIRIVDLTHDIAPQDILSGAYVLYTAWDFFPRGSTFCAVVDPGVGSDRGAVLAQINGSYLVAPDNGLISLLARMSPDVSVHALKVDSIPEPLGADRHRRGKTAAHRQAAGGTFHGRDLFAPAAALCAAGGVDQILGRRIRPVLLPAVIPELGPNTVKGKILHIDRFGNCISSVHSSDLEAVRPQRGRGGTIAVRVGAFHENGIHSTYADVAVGAPLCLFGSSGFLEIAVREGSAAQRFGLCPEQSITVTVAEP